MAAMRSVYLLLFLIGACAGAQEPAGARPTPGPTVRRPTCPPVPTQQSLGRYVSTAVGGFGIAKGNECGDRGAGAGPEIGRLSPGVTLELLAPPADGLAKVHVLGPLEVWALVPEERIGSRVLRAQALVGAPVMLGVGNIVQVRGPAEAGQVPVRAVIMPSQMADDRRAVAFEGRVAADDLGVEAPETEPPGEVMFTDEGEPLRLLSSPGGGPLWELPAERWGHGVRLLEARDGWSRVLLGHGPFLDGWIEGEVYPPGGLGLLGVDASTVPQDLRRRSEPLYRLEAGTRVELDGQLVGVLNDPGYALELERRSGGVVHALVAVDDDVSLRGEVPVEALLPASPRP